LSSATGLRLDPPPNYTSLCNASVSVVQFPSAKSFTSAHDAGQAICARIADFNGQNTAYKTRLCLRMNGLQVGRAANELSGPAAELLEEHREHLADATRVEPPLLSLKNFLQPGESVSLDLLWQLLLHICRRRAWPRAVFERERMREADLPHQLQCLIEFLLCLAGEADDDVC